MIKRSHSVLSSVGTDRLSGLITHLTAFETTNGFIPNDEMARRNLLMCTLGESAKRWRVARGIFLVLLSMIKECSVMATVFSRVYVQITDTKEFNPKISTIDGVLMTTFESDYSFESLGTPDLLHEL